jgi:predicted Fe-Mo cluster-binding NifX family protein
MLVAIPSIENNIITHRFGRMTEVTFLEIENNKVIHQFSEVVSTHHSDKKGETSGHKGCKKSQNRHQEIKDTICKADLIIYKSLCKNWRIRLQNCAKALRRTNKDLLLDVVEEITRV